jgi:prolyl oligopeptidase
MRAFLAVTCMLAAMLLAPTSDATSEPAAAPPPPPRAPVRDVTETHFGVTVHDPYRYMENLEDPEVAAWIKAQAHYTREVLDRVPHRDALYREIARYGDSASARVSGVQVSGRFVYYEKRRATDNLPKLYVRDGWRGKERLLVDPEQRKAPEGKHYAIDYYAPSPDNRYVAYGISLGGSEQSVLHVVEVATGRETGDVIDRANYSTPAWLPDGRLVYSRLQKLAAGAPVTDKYQNQRMYLHRLGSDPEQDVALFGAGVVAGIDIRPVEFVFANVVPGSHYVVAAAVNGTQREVRLWTAPIAALDGTNTPWKPVADTSDEVTDFAVKGDTLFALTHHDAPRFKVLRLSLADPDIAQARVVVAPAESVVTGLVTAADALYVRRMNGGISELLQVTYGEQATPRPVPLPYAGDIDALAADVREPGLLFSLGGWTHFGSVFAYQPGNRKVVDTGLQPQGPYDNPRNLVSEEVKARAPDGTEIPLSLVYRKGLKRDGSNPTLLWGYGSYGISELPSYSPTLLPWFDRGGIFAVAHVRGGGEYGEEWYKGGYKGTKANTWRDAIACAEWLIEHRYTSTPKLSVRGGSAGGILVGRAITERPELFAAAIDDVPVSDTLRSEFSANGVPNIPEFGSVKTAGGFKDLLEMSPYAHVKDGVAYPAVLLTTGFNDPRVDTWEPAKFAARLQAATTSGRPILLRVDYDAGHGFGSTKKSSYELAADRLAFLLWQLDVPGYQPAE